jgi:hypothetical protein
MDASQSQTDVDSFAPLEPVADGFRNYQRTRYSVPAEALLIDRAQLLSLTAPEMPVHVGGLRVLKANVGQSKHGVFTRKPEALTNYFFTNLLDMRTEWQAVSDAGSASEPASSNPQTSFTLASSRHGNDAGSGFRRFPIHRRRFPDEIIGLRTRFSEHLFAWSYPSVVISDRCAVVCRRHRTAVSSETSLRRFER